MKFQVSRLAGAVSIFVLTSCGSGIGVGQVATGVTEADLLAAPVPSLCEHEPGALVNGTLPTNTSHPGDVMIASYPTGDQTGQRMTAFGDLDGDGIDDGAFVTACNAGGVAWPATVQAYTEGPTHLGGIDLGQLTQGRELVESIGITDRSVRVVWRTNGPSDPACCPTVEMQAVLRLKDGALVPERIIKIAG